MDLLLLTSSLCHSLYLFPQLSSQYISDRFLPDKAIDLIDEAGARVRLRHIQLPEEARDLDKELKQVGWQPVVWAANVCKKVGG